MEYINQLNNSETSTHTSSPSGSSYTAGALLRSVYFDPLNAGVIEGQHQKIKHLQEQLAEFNRIRYRRLPANASRGKNVVWTLKRKSLTATDQINQQAVALYLREAIWPSNKILPTKWSKWRKDKNSLCQMILQKKCHTCWCWWKVILRVNNIRIYKQKILRIVGKL